MKIIIFGASGLVGSALVEFFSKNPKNIVISVSKSYVTNSPLRYGIDITKEIEFSGIDVKPDVVINCASLIPQAGKSLNDSSFVKSLFQTNVTGALNITKWSIESGASYLFNLSTLVTVAKPWPYNMDENYQSNPSGPHVAYSMSKLSQEQIMTEASGIDKIKIVHLRLSAVIGNNLPASGILHNLYKTAMANEDIKLVNSNKMNFNFLHVEDICHGIENGIKSQIASGLYNFASPGQISLHRLANLIKTITRSTSIITNDDIVKNDEFAFINIYKYEQAIYPNKMDWNTIENSLQTIYKSII